MRINQGSHQSGALSPQIYKSCLTVQDDKRGPVPQQSQQLKSQAQRSRRGKRVMTLPIRLVPHSYGVFASNTTVFESMAFLSAKFLLPQPSSSVQFFFRGVLLFSSCRGGLPDKSNVCCVGDGEGHSLEMASAPQSASRVGPPHAADCNRPSPNPGAWELQPLCPL